MRGELERELDICLERTEEKNPDGIGAHMRYRFACRGDVLKVIQFVNRMAASQPTLRAFKAGYRRHSGTSTRTNFTAA